MKKARALWVGLIAMSLAVACSDTDKPTSSQSDALDLAAASNQPQEVLANPENFAGTPSIAAGKIAAGNTVRVAGVGASFGNRAANSICADPANDCTVARISEGTFNSMSPADLRANYDVILTTWASSSSLNADWNTRILPYLNLGGGVIWEDDRNIGDLSPGVVGHQWNNCCFVDPITNTIPGLTDGVSGGHVNVHFRVTSWVPEFTPFLTWSGSTVGLAGEFAGGGRMVMLGPDADFHAQPGSAQYILLTNAIFWTSSGITNQAPIADAGDDQTIECEGPLTDVTLDGSGSSDPDGDALSYAWTGGASGVGPTIGLGLGSHTITLTVDDGNGGSATDDVQIDIVDTTAPEVSFSLDVTELWPPNHEMVVVATGISASDICDDSPQLAISVSSNEPENGTGDGDTAPDWEVIDNGDGTFDVAVRAERKGNGDGRVYTISVVAVDGSNNASDPVSAEVTVAHDKGGKGKGKGKG